MRLIPVAIIINHSESDVGDIDDETTNDWGRYTMIVNRY